MEWGHFHCTDYELLLFILEELQFRQGQGQTSWKQCEMGVDIRLYRDETGHFGIRQCKLFVNSHIIKMVKNAHIWIFRLIAAVC
jgi:hypothetical protein